MKAIGERSVIGINKLDKANFLFILDFLYIRKRDKKKETTKFKN